MATQLASQTQVRLSSPFGMVAGNGAFPLEVARALKSQGISVYAVAYRGETDPQIEGVVERCEWMAVGQLKRLTSFFVENGVSQVTFVGGISRSGLLKTFRPDVAAIALLARVRSVADDVVLRAVAGELEVKGIAVLAPHAVIPECVPQAGQLTSRALSPSELADARIGWQAAKAIGQAEIGQTVVVCREMVVAVEAIEGTDATIKRAGEIAGKGCVVVKVSKPQQDLRLDLPAVGEETIHVMQSVGASALVLEAGRAMILGPQAVVYAANQAGIAIAVFEGQP